MRRLFAGREPLYREVADLVVEAADGDAEQHADTILAALERWHPAAQLAAGEDDQRDRGGHLAYRAQHVTGNAAKPAHAAT